MDAKSIFLNQYNRLRSGWRFLIFLLAFIFFAGLAAAIAQQILFRLEIDFQTGSPVFLAVNGFLSFAIALLLGWLCGKYFEGLPFRALGAWFTANWLKDLVAGIFLGAFTLCFAVLIAIIFGGLKFQINQNHGTSAILLTLTVSLAIFAFSAAFEEAFFRGYILQTFTRARLAWVAIILTAAFFAFGHLNNPNADYISSLNTGLAGIWLGIAYLKTRNLWFPFGIHLAWNWMLGAFFGIEVSGLKNITVAPVLQEIDSGPAWLTGEQYGIEGGIACSIALIVSTAFIYFLPFLRPTDEMLALTSGEKYIDAGTRRRGDAEKV